MRLSIKHANVRRSGPSLSRVVGSLITFIIIFMTAAPVVIYAEKDKDKEKGKSEVVAQPPGWDNSSGNNKNKDQGDDEVVVLPPIGDNPGGASNDESLLQYLKVSVYQKFGDDWVLVKEFTSELSGAAGVRLTGNHYQVNWHELLDPEDESNEPGKGNVLQGEYRVVISVAGLEIETFDIVFDKGADKGDADNVLNERGNVPIKVAINDNGAIRTRILTEQGYSASDIARILQQEFELSASDTAKLLYDENFSALDVGLALKDIYNLSAGDCAASLKSAGFAAEGTAKVLATTYAATLLDAGQIMADIDYTIDQIWAGLKAAWSALTSGDILELFHQLSYTADEVIKFLYYGLEWTVAQVLDGINAAAYWAVDAAEWLWHGLGWTGGQIIAGLKAAGYLMEDVAQWLWDGLAWTGEQIVAGLTAVGYALQDVGLWFYDALNYTAEGFAYVLDALGYAADAIVNAMTGIWDVTQDGAKYILIGLGYAVDFVDDLLGSIFGTVICTELYRQGYLSAEIYAADVEFGKWIEKHLPQVLKGYQFLAAPIVSQMQQSKSFTNGVWFFARPWSEEMAYMTGVSDQENFGGALIMVVGIPLCFIVVIFVTLGYSSLAALILLLGIAFVYRKGYLPTLNFNHGRVLGNLRLVNGNARVSGLIAFAS